MTTIRTSNSQTSRRLINAIFDNRQKLDKASSEITTGLKVLEPGDSKNSGTISRLQDTQTRLDGYKNRIAETRSNLTYQDDVMAQVNELIIRGKEIATQAANESNGTARRAEMAEEVFQLRDQLVTLANTQYLGRFIYGGADDDDPPYDPAAPYGSTAPLPNPGVPTTGPASVRYRFDAEMGSTTVKQVKITDDLTVDVNTDGSALFNNAIFAFERLGRSLAGYATTPAAPAAPDDRGAAYTFPADFSLQTRDIQGAIDLLDTAREQDIMPERVNLGARLKRLDTAEGLLQLAKTSTTEVLDRLQAADITESATSLSLAQTALQASYTLSSKILNLTILNFI